MAYGDDTIVVNRTTKPLEFTYDGRHGQLKPGYRIDNGKVVPAGRNGRPALQHMAYQVAEMARRQNVILGTENPFDLREVQYLVGIGSEDGDKLVADPNWPNNSIAPVEQSQAVERLNRKLLDDEAQTAQPRRSAGWPQSREAAKGGEGFKAGNDSLVGIDTRG